MEVSLSRIISVMASGVVLCLSNATLPAVGAGSDCAERKGGDQSTRLKCETDIHQGIETVKGDVLRVEGDNFLVQRSDGREVRMHFDESTQMFGYVGPGERVEAQMNKEGHALSIRIVE